MGSNSDSTLSSTSSSPRRLSITDPVASPNTLPRRQSFDNDIFLSRNTSQSSPPLQSRNPGGGRRSLTSGLPFNESDLYPKPEMDKATLNIINGKYKDNMYDLIKQLSEENKIKIQPKLLEMKEKEEKEKKEKEERLKKALIAEEELRKTGVEKDDRKRQYNSRGKDDYAVTEEEIEAYKLKRQRSDDPMKDFL